MRELLELQTGQVAFISGLMSGFSLSIAAHVLRYGIQSRVAQAVFLMFLVSSLLFLVALYVDVRLSIALAGMETVSDPILQEITMVRNIGTSCATVALVIFVLATGLMGWLASVSTGILSTLIVTLLIGAFWYLWHSINLISALIGG